MKTKILLIEKKNYHKKFLFDLRSSKHQNLSQLSKIHLVILLIPQTLTKHLDNLKDYFIDIPPSPHRPGTGADLGRAGSCSPRGPSGRRTGPCSPPPQGSL